jgi:hypothetical protein
MSNLFMQGLTLEQLQELMRSTFREELSKVIPQQQDEKLLSPKEARKIWQPAVSLVTLDKWEKEGHLKAHWYGGRKFYRLSEILAAAKVLQPYNRGGVK